MGYGAQPVGSARKVDARVRRHRWEDPRGGGSWRSSVRRGSGQVGTGAEEAGSRVAGEGGGGRRSSVHL